MILDCFASIWGILVDKLVEMWTIHVRLWIGGVSGINLNDSGHLWTIKDGLGSRIVCCLRTACISLVASLIPYV